MKNQKPPDTIGVEKRILKFMKESGGMCVLAIGYKTVMFTVTAQGNAAVTLSMNLLQGLLYSKWVTNVKKNIYEITPAGLEMIGGNTDRRRKGLS